MTQKKDREPPNVVLISTKEWGIFKKKIWESIYSYIINNKKEIDKIYTKSKNIEIFRDYLQNTILNHLKKNTDLLNRLSKHQLIYISKIIYAIYLILEHKPPLRAEISRIIGLDVREIRSLLEHFKLIIPSYLWDSYKKQIWDEIYNFIEFQKDIITSFEEKKDENLVCEYLKNQIIVNLRDKGLLKNLTDKQLSYIPKVIMVIYLISREEPAIESKIKEISGLYKKEIRRLIDYFKVCLPKYKIYRDSDVKEWIKEYKKVGSFEGVRELIKEKYELEGRSIPSGTTIFNRIKNYLSEEEYNKLVFGEEIELKENEELAEMVGIILGDGGLYITPFKQYELEIALNGVDEYPYVQYVEVLMEKMFTIKPRRKWAKDAEGATGDEKGIELIITNKSVVENLILKGLKTGNKVKNQVSVPSWIRKSPRWIKENREKWEKKFKLFVIVCLRGLTDTDGSIFINHQDGRAYIYISFKSASKPLANDYKEMCKSLGFKTSSISEDKYEKEGGEIGTSYIVTISSKENVKNFIEIIKPIKWKLKKMDIAKRLKEYGTTIEDVFKYKYSRYSKEYAEHLKSLYEQLGIYAAIKKYLSGQGEPRPSKDTIVKYLKKLFKEKEYIKLFNEDGFQKWFNNNSRISLCKENKKIKAFPIHLKILICRKIFQLIIDYRDSIENSQILKILIDFFNKSVLIDDFGNKHLIFGRISYLLNNKDYQNAIIRYFQKHIDLVKFIKKGVKESKTYIQISRILDYPSELHVKKIIDDLKKQYPNYF